MTWLRIGRFYVPIYLDSPLAIKATEIYKDYEDLYDKTSLDLIFLVMNC